MTPVALRRLVRRAKNLTHRSCYRLRDRHLPSYGNVVSGELARLVPAGVRFDLGDADAQAVQHFLAHRFNLLGSGWVRVHYGMEVTGFEGVRYPSVTGPLEINEPNRRGARAASEMLSADYQPIDWHIDFKSGYRWSALDWYRGIRFGVAEGADIKVPWELSRMQHLPELAMAFTAGKQPALAREFSDQVLDWIGANPPRFGVNWVSTMEVGIRVANWLIAFDLFRAAGATFAPEFVRLFVASVVDHAQHIARNLEWSETHRANHYLANVAGLLIASAYLPRTPQTDAWLAFSIQEMIGETDRQFLEEGAHFEASTNYHRLCGEMMATAAVIVRALPESRLRVLFAVDASLMRHGPGLQARTAADFQATFSMTGTVLPARFLQRLSLAAEFTRALTRPDGSVPQIGDNDSGRFWRLGGWVREGTIAESRDRYANLEATSGLADDQDYLTQSPADHQQWLAWAGAAVGRPELPDSKHSDVWAHVRTLTDALLQTATPVPSIATVAAAERFPTRGAEPAADGRVAHERRGVLTPGGGDLLADVSVRAYPVFGLYLITSRRLHLVIRCGNAMNDHLGVHAHEDQLAFDLWLDGTHVAADPGTYVYTASTSWRNRYRDAGAHYAPTVNGPSNPSHRGAFAPPTRRLGVCVEFQQTTFVGRTEIEGGSVTRTIRVHADRIEVLDEYQLAPPWTPASNDPFSPARPVPHSSGYGVRLK